MATPKFEYRGDLSTLPLAEILSTIHRYRVPGVVSVSRDGRIRRVYVDDGLITFAASNERELGLAAFLLGQGLLDAERLDQRLGYAQKLLERSPGGKLSLYSAPEHAFYRAVDGKTPLQQLSARGPASQSENVRLLYAFFCLGLLRRMRVTASGAKK